MRLAQTVLALDLLRIAQDPKGETKVSKGDKGRCRSLTELWILGCCRQRFSWPDGTDGYVPRSQG